MHIQVKNRINFIRMKNELRLYIIVFIIFSSTLTITQSKIYAQTGIQEEWVARYDGSNTSDVAKAITIDNAGNIYVTGWSSSSETHTDYGTIKYNSMGDEQWVSIYNGTESNLDEAQALTIDDSGNVYVTGWSQASYYADYATVKYNSEGVQQWVTRYNGPGNSADWAVDIDMDNSGNVYVTGWSFGTDTHKDYLTIKYNSAGEEQWVVRYNGLGNYRDEATALALDDSGNVYITGWSAASRTYPFEYDYATVKYNSEGAQQWIARFNGESDSTDKAFAIAIDDSGNIYVTGKSYGLNTDYDCVTIKYNSNGVEQWMDRYNGVGNYRDMGTEITTDNSGNIIVSGSSWGVDDDYVTIKYYSNSIQQWVNRYNSTGNYYDFVTGLTVDRLGNVYVTGISYGISSGEDYTTIKYSSDGIEEWVVQYNGPGNYEDFPFGIAVDDSGAVFVTGGSSGLGTNHDYATIKYIQATVSVDEEPMSAPMYYSLTPNYPNPFNTTTNIKFSIPNDGLVTLSLYNLHGRKLETILSRRLNRGIYSVVWDGTGVSSGTYFVRMVSGDFVQTRKIVLLK